jgi:hypothetical protein
MEIDVSQLQMGDEFFFASNGRMARAKVIRPIKVKKNQPTYNPMNTTYYASVKCKVAAEEITYTYTWRGGTRIYKKKRYNTSEKYTVEKFLNLNGNNLWLVKRDD